MKLGGIYISVQAKTDKLKRDLAKAKTMTGKAAVYMKNSLSKINFARVGVAAAAFGVAYVAVMKKAIDAASDLQEMQAKFDVVFRDHKEQAEDMAKVLVDSYNMSTREAKEYMASIQDLLVPMGMASGAALKMSDEVVKLASDLGSFNNLETSQVMLDIQSALVGNFETMKKYGVILNETVTKQKAYQMGLYSGKGLLDANTKAQVAFKLIMEGSAAAIGDTQRNVDTYAYQIRRLKSNIEDVSAAIGKELLPAVTDWVKHLNTMIQQNPEAIKQIGEFAKRSLELAEKIAFATVKVFGFVKAALELTGVLGMIEHGLDIGKSGGATGSWAEIPPEYVDSWRNLNKAIKESNKEIKTVAGNTKKLTQEEIDLAKAVKKAEEEFYIAENNLTSLDLALRRGGQGLTVLTKEAEESEKAFKGLSFTITDSFVDGFVDAILDADQSFKEFARNFLREITKMIAKLVIMNAIKSASSSIFSAKGNTFDQSGVTAFAGGGVVNSPTAFAFAGGTGIMGEAGPEAIMPLKRGNDGNLGVASSGGEPQTVNYVIQAIDSKSFLDTVRRNPDAITMVMNEQMERGNSALNSNIRRVAQ